MWGSSFKPYAILLSVIFLFSCFTVSGDNSNIMVSSVEDDFYFVQITDTHVMHELFDRYGNSKMRLVSVLENISDFEDKPAFVAVTGDLVEWGTGCLGALNFQAFVDCFYEDDGQFYADSDLTIPVYTTPGNHDYVWENNLDNYHNYITSEDRYVVTIGDATFYFMNSGPNYYREPWDWILILAAGLYDDDITWLEEGFSSCESTYKIVLMHHPAVNTRTDFGRMEDVIKRNRQKFIELCEEYEVELVLTGHTHSSRIYDGQENRYTDLPLNCNDYSTLFVQTDDCKQGIHYRNISVTSEGVILQKTQELEYKPLVKSRFRDNSIMYMIFDILKNS